MLRELRYKVNDEECVERFTEFEHGNYLDRIVVLNSLPAVSNLSGWWCDEDCIWHEDKGIKK